MTKKAFLILLIIAAALRCAAAPIDEAKALYRSGQYSKAISQLEAILKKAPKDGTANYYLGLSYLGLGETKKALTSLQKAEDRGVIAAAERLAQIAFDEYRFTQAQAHLDTWEKLLHKEKKSAPQSLTDMRAKIVIAKNMLERVEKIVIVDSIEVDSADFFRHFPISAEAGRLLSPSILGARASQRTSMVFAPQNGKEEFWSMPGRDGKMQIISAQILDNGDLDTQMPLGDDLGEGGDADYPFFLSDGVTFYFANNGENSLGGYDIFLSRRSADKSVLQPQNIGMPYNSPYNDYMLVIDESKHRGWWATDRNQVPGKVTIYEFVPNETRENYDPTDPNIARYALITSIADTQQGSYVPAPSRTVTQVVKQPDFVLPLCTGQVYTSLGDFKNAQARQEMEQYIECERNLPMMTQMLAGLRRNYRPGDTMLASKILQLEKSILSTKDYMRSLRNSIITHELNLK